MWALDGFNFGSRELWTKLSNILTTELNKKREPLDKQYLVDLM